jgi:cation:H+ antiporter
MVRGGTVPDTPLVNGPVIVVATGSVWLGSGWLEDVAEGLPAYYGLPAVVRGSVVVVAVGSSLPEFASVLATALAGAFDTGCGGIVGSATAEILATPALSGILPDGERQSGRTVVYREAQLDTREISDVDTGRSTAWS